MRLQRPCTFLQLLSTERLQYVRQKHVPKREQKQKQKQETETQTRLGTELDEKGVGHRQRRSMLQTGGELMSETRLQRPCTFLQLLSQGEQKHKRGQERKQERNLTSHKQN